MGDRERKGSLRESLDCFTCKKSYTDKHKLIQCGRCEYFFCMLCTDMTASKLALIKDPATGAMWFCPTCQKPVAKSIKTDKEIELRCKEYCEKWDKRLDELEKKVDQKVDKQVMDKLLVELNKVKASLSDKVDKDDLLQLQNEITTMKSDRRKMEDDVQLAVDRQMYDWKEREKRRANIMIYGVDEKSEEDTVSDRQQVTKFLEGQLELSNITVVKMYRVGKLNKSATTVSDNDIQGAAANIVDKRSRPIKVTLSSASEKSKVMTKYREKKDQKSQLDYGISSDFTKSETQRYQLLKAELKRREEAGENNWCIRKLQLVKKK